MIVRNGRAYGGKRVRRREVKIGVQRVRR